MKKKRTIYLIVSLMSFSLLLIIGMQSSHIIRSYNTKKELVDRGVRESLSQALRKLEKQDALIFVYDKMAMGKHQKYDSTYPVDPNMSQFGYTPGNHGQKHHNFSISISSSNGTMQVVEFSNYMNYSDASGSFMSYSVAEQFFNDNYTNSSIDLQDVLDELEKEYEIRQRPIETRFDKNVIKDLISKELKQRGLDLDFEFAVANGDQQIKLKSDNFSMDQAKDAYKMNLAPSNILSNPDELYIYFPGKRKYVLEGVLAQVISSVVFMLIILITFGITLFTVYRQKKLTEIKNDFINNMTHEFKTPLATIQLAAASINNPKVRENPVAMDKFTEIINQETHRMNNHVEQVLQLALLDRESLSLKKEPIDMHELIKDAVGNVELIIQERNGVIKTELNADKFIVIADRDTLLNVIHNLLDNANKYSTESPEITIYTHNLNNQFIFEVDDKGIGMSKEVQNHIFDKFYRASTGNIHNIKGFGLGLNYVREIILAHKGNIQIKSTPCKGSTFIISLPIKNT